MTSPISTTHASAAALSLEADASRAAHEAAEQLLRQLSAPVDLMMVFATGLDLVGWGILVGACLIGMWRNRNALKSVHESSLTTTLKLGDECLGRLGTGTSFRHLF